MFGGSSKFGRGGAGAGRGSGSKRLHPSFPAPHRPPAPAGAGRLSLRGSGSAPNPRNRASGSTPSEAVPAVEESFSLVAGNNPLEFGMIIRLAPDLVDEIRRVEAQGGTPKIKFGANNPNGNVIDVGGKEFRFTWSKDSGDLCDIYEERESGEDGNGLLVESGCAWRKLNVQRVLDESTKNHVKMRSEEAERKLKSRRAIVLDHGNPSMKSQIKQLVAVETNPWKHFKQKKEPPPKKRKIEPPPGAHHKSVFKSGTSSKTIGKGKQSSSPLPSPPEQSVPSASPLRSVNISKSNANVEDVIHTQATGKDRATASSDKEIPAKASGVVHETVGRKGNIGAKQTDLHSMLLTLLKENPKGMSLKALEKAAGDSIPNSIRQIEPILKKIATFQAPGRYILKSGVELESFKKPLSESGSSPEESLQKTPAPEDNHDKAPAQEPQFEERVPSDEFEEHGQLNSELGDPNALEKIDIQQHSPDRFGEKKGSDNSEGHVGSSSDSGSDSDSDSDSSDSGSDSGSPSRSRSRSSSDSDSDATINSKEGSDEDVDIISDDDKEPNPPKLQASEPEPSRSPIPWRGPDGRTVQVGNDEKQDDNELDAVDIVKDLSNGKQDIEMALVNSSVPDRDEERPVEKTKTHTPNHDDLLVQHFNGKLFDEGDGDVKDSSRHEQSDSSEKTSKGKYKRGAEVKQLDEKSEQAKRLKTENLYQTSISGARDIHFQEKSSRKLSSDRVVEDPYWGPVTQATNGADRDGNTKLASQKGISQAFAGKSSSDLQQSGRRSFEQSEQTKAPNSSERPNSYAESLGRGQKYSEKGSHVRDNSPLQKVKSHRDAQFEDGYANEKKFLKNSKEDGLRGKRSVPSDSDHRKRGEAVGKLQEAPVSGSFVGSSPKDRSPFVNGRGGKLQRELSDLELGELRENLSEEIPAKKQKSSFKQSENNPGPSDHSLDLSKWKPPGKATSDFGKSCSPDLNARVPSSLEVSTKRRNHEECVEDLTRSHQRPVHSQSQYPSRVYNVELGPKSNKFAEPGSNSRHNEGGGRGSSLEGYGESNKKALVSASQHDTRRGPVSHSTKESKKQTSNTVRESIDARIELVSAEGNHSVRKRRDSSSDEREAIPARKRRDSSSDENSCSYSKYEKDEPDLKGPIKDFSQYKEYVQEYRDKYDSYCSLNKVLENYRNEFQKLGKDLDYAKVGRDTERYYNILEQLKESYHQCGKRHKRLKKIFVVLHEELKHLKQRIKDYALSCSNDRERT
ncbi:hypothetical protein UlMin_011840 [Ulmus minor]